jgi:chromosome segregation ATPase
MADLNQAIEQVRGVARTFQAVIDLSEAVGQLASLEQAVSENRAALAKLQAENAAEQARSADLAVQAQATIDEANAKAEAVMQSAQAHADTLMADAQGRVDILLAGANAETETAANAVAEAKATLTSIETDIAARSQELADIHAKIERAKAKMAEILGA